MNVAFDLCHPAQFHLFKHLMELFRKRGHGVHVHIKEKDSLRALLDHEGWKYTVSPAGDKTSLSAAYAAHLKSYLAFAKGPRPELHLGSSVVQGTAARLLGGEAYCFSEDDFAVAPAWKWLNITAGHIVRPSSLQFEGGGRRTIYHDSYHELAYLHPDIFTPDESVPRRYGLTPGRYVVARFSAMGAYHDKGESGAPEAFRRVLDEGLPEVMRVVRSVEDGDETDIEPWDMHHVLAFARLLAGDSQSMAMEAAALGVPSVRCNSFVGRITVLNELEEKYGLTFGFRPENANAAAAKIIELAEGDSVEEKFAERRGGMLAEKINLLDWMARLFGLI